MPSRRRSRRRRGDQVDQGERRAGRAAPAASWSGTRSRPATPASASHFVRCAFSVARGERSRRPASAAGTSSASGLLKRNISAATGVSAIAAPASSPAAGPNRPADGQVEHARPSRRPSAPRAPGSTTRQAEEPHRQRHRATATAGGLSTVMELPASEEPKKNAFQLCDAGLDGGGVERVGPAGGAEVPEVEQRRCRPAGPAARAAPSGVAVAGRARSRLTRAGRGRRRARRGLPRRARGARSGRVVVIGRSPSRATAGLPSAGWAVAGCAGCGRPSRGRAGSAAASRRALAATSTASSVDRAGVAVAASQARPGEPLVSARPEAEHDQALQLVARGAGRRRGRRR